MRRLFLILPIALVLAPGTWVRTDPVRSYSMPIMLTALDTSEAIEGQLEVTRLWHLASRNGHFGGYSALDWRGGKTLLAVSDRGRMLELPLDDGGPVAAGARLDFFPGIQEIARNDADLEAITIDQDTGTIWAALENTNTIRRVEAGGAITQRRPVELTRWARNSGPETLVKLHDGRFLVLSEGIEDEVKRTRPGALFAGDPVDEGPSTTFRIDTPPGFSPVDATQLPSGEVLILLRRVYFTVPATFETKLMLADLDAIEEGGEWTGEIVAELSGGVYDENFEGLAFVPDKESEESGSLFLISDDNISLFQRTLLLRLGWPGQRAPGEPDESAADK